jgi:hypothetical protein
MALSWVKRLLQKRRKVGASIFHELSMTARPEAEHLRDHRPRGKWEETTAD